MHYTFTIELMELFNSITDHILWPILRIGTSWLYNVFIHHTYVFYGSTDAN